MAARRDQMRMAEPEPWEIHTNIVEAWITARAPAILGVSDAHFRESVPWPRHGDQLLAIPLGKKREIIELAEVIEVTIHSSALAYMLSQHQQVNRGPHWVRQLGFDNLGTVVNRSQSHAQMGAFEAMGFPIALRRLVVKNLPQDAKRFYFPGATQAGKMLAADYHPEASGRMQFEFRMHELNPHRYHYAVKSGP